MSVRELEESQKMICKFNLCEMDTHSRGQSTVDGNALLVNTINDEKIDFLSAKIEVFEAIRPM